MKLFSVLFLAASFALVACGDDSSSSAPADDNGSSSKTKYDCSVSGGVKVVYPTGGETFHLGDTITVVYGSDVLALKNLMERPATSRKLSCPRILPKRVMKPLFAWLRTNARTRAPIPNRSRSRSNAPSV